MKPALHLRPMQNAIALLLFLLPSALVASERACAVPGHAVQWIADYCMYKEQTDDLVAASDCIEQELVLSDAVDDCATKLRYKTELCKLHMSGGSRDGTLTDCVNDAAFSGNIVRDDGAR